MHTSPDHHSFSFHRSYASVILLLLPVQPYELSDTMKSIPATERLYAAARQKQEQDQQRLKEKMMSEEQNQECTFQPKVNPESHRLLAASMRKSHGDSDVTAVDDDLLLTERAPLYERAIQLEKQKQDWVAKQRLEQETKNEDLRFHPKITKATKHIIETSARMGEAFIQTDVVQRMKREDV
jgi:hypothetical protein